MKNLLKFFALMAVLFSAVTETAEAQIQRGISNSNAASTSANFSDKAPPSLPIGQVLEEYIDHEGESNFNCLYMTIATNEVYRGKKFPISTWSQNTMVAENNSLKTIGSSKRFWSSRKYERQNDPLLYQPF